MAHITLERLKELLTYEPKTGVFTWNETAPRHIKGEIVGTKTSHGYLCVTIDGRQYYLHRLAWFWLNGWVPNNPFCVDHVNGDRKNNSFNNLRMINRGQNKENLHKAHSNNKSTNMLGAYKQNGRFISRIQINGESIYLGSFKSAEDAHQAYLERKREVHSLGEI